MIALPCYAQETLGPKIWAGVVDNVGTEWQTITLPLSYATMVVAATPVYTDSQKPAVVRIRNAGGNSFDVRVQNPSGDDVSGYSVHYITVEAGVYSFLQDGIHLEAFIVDSDQADHAGDWSGQPVNYANDYAEPVVLGQVMSFNDSRWSVFWSRGLFPTSPPGVFINIGNHVGEDDIIERSEEKVGYIILETSAGAVDGYFYEAFLGDDIVGGIENDAPFVYSHVIEEPSVAILSSAGMDGVNGGWPVLWGDGELEMDQLRLAIDEDQIGDSERQHTTEQVAVLLLQQNRMLPEFALFEPKRGEVGASVSIKGVRLSTIEEVYIDQVRISQFVIQSDEEIKITIPEDADSGIIRMVDNQGVELTSVEPFIVTYANVGAGMNLCRLTSARVSQSSNETPQTGPENACDGIRSGSLENATIASTGVENESWWEVDLGDLYDISDVIIKNRSDCCQESLADFFVFISDVPFLSKSVQVTLAEPVVRTYFVDTVLDEAQIPIGHAGRYIRLQHPVEGAIGLSEVEVVATDGNVLSVSNEGEGLIEPRLALASPYPVPATDIAHLSYSVSQPGHVELAVYNVLGQRVMKVVDDVQASGEYRVSISVGGLASGVYTIRMASGPHYLSRTLSIRH